LDSCEQSLIPLMCWAHQQGQNQAQSSY